MIPVHLSHSHSWQVGLQATLEAFLHFGLTHPVPNHYFPLENNKADIHSNLASAVRSVARLEPMS